MLTLDKTVHKNRLTDVNSVSELTLVIAMRRLKFGKCIPRINQRIHHGALFFSQRICHDGSAAPIDCM